MFRILWIGYYICLLLTVIWYGGYLPHALNVDLTRVWWGIPYALTYIFLIVTFLCLSIFKIIYINEKKQ